MDQPLGFAVGNALEVKEAIATLKGEGPDDLLQLCLVLGSQMLLCAGVAKEEAEAETLLKETITDGRALKKFSEFIAAQGGRAEEVYDTSTLPRASIEYALKAEQSGYVGKIFSEEVGTASLLLGGGRRSKEDVIDLSVGIILKKKVGDKVDKGDTLAVLYANDEQKLTEAKERLLGAYTITETPVERPLFIKKIIKG